MKRILTLLVLVFAVKSASAQVAGQTQAYTPVLEVVPSSVTCRGQSISSSTVTNVIVSTSTLYQVLYIENEDANNAIFCDDDASVATSGSARGKKIFPNNGGKNDFFTLRIPYWQNFYCLAATASVNAMVCREY